MQLVLSMFNEPRVRSFRQKGMEAHRTKWTVVMNDDAGGAKNDLVVRKPFIHQQRPVRRYSIDDGMNFSLNGMPILQNQSHDALTADTSWSRRKTRTVAVKLSDPRPKGNSAMKDFSWMVKNKPILASRVLIQINHMESFARSIAIGRIMRSNRRNEEVVKAELACTRRRHLLRIPSSRAPAAK